DFITIVGVGSGLRERRQGDVRRSVAIRGVDGRVLARMVGLVLVVPVLARTGQLRRTDAAEGEPGAVAGGAGALVPGLLEDAVAGHHGDVRQRGPKVLPELARVLSGDRPDV